MWWTAGSAKRPLPLSSTVFAIHPLFWSTGCQQASAESGGPSESLSAVDTDTRFKHVRSPPAVSDTVSLDGWTGHLRRTVRNPLRSGRFLCCCMAACQVNVTVGNSGHTMVGRLAPPRRSASSPACSVLGSDLSGRNACPSREGGCIRLESVYIILSLQSICSAKTWVFDRQTPISCISLHRWTDQNTVSTVYR